MEILELNEDLVIGAGGHKKVYIDPRDNKRCIKILLEEKCIMGPLSRPLKKYLSVS